MNMAELHDKSVEELRVMRDDLKKDLAQAVLEAHGRGEHAHVGPRKKDLARILTVLHSKQKH